MSSQVFLYIFLSYAAVINMLSFVFFGFDKVSAYKKKWRVSEKTLWGLALFGGSIGGLLGMKFFRHKTRKTSFQFIYALIILVQILAAVFYMYYLQGDASGFSLQNEL